MTRRERYQAILTGGRADATPWVPNFDHWLVVNEANGTVPPAYRGMSRNDIVRAVDATIWARTQVIREEQPNVRVDREEIPGVSVRFTFTTPVGTVQTLHRYASDLTHALFLTEHMIKEPRDIAVARFIVEDTRYTLDTAPFLQSEKEVGDDGISLVTLPICMPYIRFGKTDAGWERGIYLWYDHREEVERLMEAYACKAEEAARLVAQSPVLLATCGDNMDEWTTPPDIFRRYAIPFYRRIARILHQAGKVFQVHWCGRTQNLLPMVPECDIDVVEAVTVRPMADLTVPQALEKVGDRVVIQGGIPSICMCPQGGTRDELCRYVEDLLTRVPVGYRYAVGMSDNVPPDADFERVRMISDIVNGR